ncbi:MAG: DUF3574 domain-containing protein [Chamaesiphon sp. CSU_1_12]|nr:DUF3574 domain-containing protein [Chamaesiphon sp. CSU_1_12]
MEQLYQSSFDLCWITDDLDFYFICSSNHSSTDKIENKHSCSNVLASKPVARTELFLGLRKSNGTEVNNSEFQQFLDREVTPRFPDGFTIISGQGQFKNDRGAILQERSKLLILLYPIAATSSQKVEKIRTAYIAAFQQQSVLRTDNLSCAAF